MYSLTLRIGKVEHVFNFPSYAAAYVAATALALLTTPWTRHCNVSGPVSHMGYYVDLYNEGSIVIKRDERIPDKIIWVSVGPLIVPEELSDYRVYLISTVGRSGPATSHHWRDETADLMFKVFKEAGYERIDV